MEQERRAHGPVYYIAIATVTVVLLILAALLFVDFLAVRESIGG